MQDAGKIILKEVKQSQTTAVDLTEANIIITGGRPIAAEENYKILQECADLVGAAVGASRRIASVRTRGDVPEGSGGNPGDSRGYRVVATPHGAPPAECTHEERSGVGTVATARPSRLTPGWPTEKGSKSTTSFATEDRCARKSINC